MRPEWAKERAKKQRLVEHYAKKCDPFLAYRCLSTVRWDYLPHFGGLPTASEFLANRGDDGQEQEE